MIAEAFHGWDPRSSLSPLPLSLYIQRIRKPLSAGPSGGRYARTHVLGQQFRRPERLRVLS